MPEQSLADLQRLVDRSRRDSRHNYGAHPTGAGGSLHTPHPKQGAGRKQIGPGEFGLSRPPIGEIIRLSVHGHLGNGGEPALFDSITYQNGFNQATAPNPQLQLPYNAIYGIEGEIRWTDGYTGGGEVWLYLDAAPYMQLPGFTDAWTRWSIAMEFDAQKGARLSLVVVHDDSADHDLEGEVVVATKERLVQLVQEPTIDPESITMISEATGVQHDNYPNGTPAEAGDLYVTIVLSHHRDIFDRDSEDRTIVPVDDWVKEAEVFGTPEEFEGDTYRLAAAVLWRTADGGESSADGNVQSHEIVGWEHFMALWHIPGGGTIADTQLTVDQLLGGGTHNEQASAPSGGEVWLRAVRVAGANSMTWDPALEKHGGSDETRQAGTVSQAGPWDGTIILPGGFSPDTFNGSWAAVSIGGS